MKKEKLRANWADPSTTAENERLPRWLKWVWSGRGIAFSLNFLLMAQVTYYCTDMLGMPAAVVGTLLLVSKVFDAFTDVMAGYIIDRTKTKWGKARPYDIFMPLTWLCTVLLFSTPNFGMVGKCIYVFLLYTITNSVCCTFASCGDGIYLKRAIRSENNKVSVTSFQGALLMLFSIAVGIIMPQLISTVGATKSGWTIIALVYAVPMAIIGSLRMLTVKEVLGDEVDAATETKKVAFKDAVRALSKNKLIFLLMILVVVYQMISTANGLTYYFKWIFGDIGLASMLGLASLVIPLVLIFIPALTRKIGTSKLMVVGMIVNLVGCVLRMIFPYNIGMLMLAQALTLIGVLPLSSLLSIYTLECMDYGQKVSGVNIDGVTGALSGFAMKVGSAVGSAIMGFMMGASGYISDPAATAQPESAIGMIRFMFATMPVIFAVVTLVVGYLYTTTKKKVLK
ncbi:MAG: MFS transporter [Firmicutes bacterium]|nr:MFS transporter [Bacillota bacterium]